jgi:hypothetical protein
MEPENKMDETDNVNGLIQEIAWLRGAIRELMHLARGVDDLDQMAKVLNAAGTAITRLGQALKLQRELVEDLTSVNAEIRQKLVEIGEHLKR